MTLETLVKELQAIMKVHPKAKDAQVIAENIDGGQIRVSYVGYDTKHSPSRIKLEE
jgi:hypothetical protein